jgi:hypothetical protein
MKIVSTIGLTAVAISIFPWIAATIVIVWNKNFTTVDRREKALKAKSRKI